MENRTGSLASPVLERSTLGQLHPIAILTLAGLSTRVHGDMGLAQMACGNPRLLLKF
jgi:hypothetical protein